MVSENKAYNGYVGLSTDNKPTRSVNNGSMFYEMNTQKKYMFDEEGVQWIEQPEQGGGSTGGGGLVVTWDTTTDECDKTYAEVKAACEAGQQVWIYVAEATDAVDVYSPVTEVYEVSEDTSTYYVKAKVRGDSFTFYATSEDENLVRQGD